MLNILDITHIENLETILIQINNTLINVYERQEECCGENMNCDKWIYLYEDCRIQNRCEFPEVWIQGNCVNVTCFGLLFDDVDVCSGNGICIGYNDCHCRDNWIGDECETTEPC